MLNRIPSNLNSLLVAVLSTAMVFGWYSTLRAMVEVVGFHVDTFFACAALSVLLSAPVVCAMALLFRATSKPMGAKALFVLYLLGALTGVFVAESSMLVDEAAFRTEAALAQASGAPLYARDRAWPNQGTSLVWNRDSGVHATD